MKKTIGIIFADNGEYLPFKQYAAECNPTESTRRGNESIHFDFTAESGKEYKIIAVKCGIGKVCSASAAAFLIADDKADILLNAGFSGAVSGLRRGDIAAGSSYTECDFDLCGLGYEKGIKPEQDTSVYTADRRLLDAALSIKNVKKATLGTGDFFLDDCELKSSYKKIFGINAFDMESGAIAAVCYKSRTPFLSLRKISDDAQDSAAEAYREINESMDSSLSEILFKIITVL